MHRLRPILQILAILAGIASAAAAPFQVNAPSELRADFTCSWSDFSTVHNTPVPTDTAFAASDGGPDVTVFGESGNLNISTTDPVTPGILLENGGPGRLVIDTHRPVQGVGLIIEQRLSVTSDYFIECFDESSAFLGFVTTTSPGPKGDPAFLGMVDPDARIRFVVISALPGNNLVVSDPVFQLRPDLQTNPANLPVTATATRAITNTETYLHEGLVGAAATPATTQATIDNPNACDLRVDFPTLRGGDIIHFERVGIAVEGGRVNPLLCALSKSEEIRSGNALHRLPGALEAGSDYYTRPSTGGSFSTPTNIREDFVVGASTFIEVPQDANYAMFSLAKPSENSSPVSVRLSLIERTQFLDWLASFGLHGPLTALDHDLDGDKLKLIEEFAFGLDPTTVDSGINEEFAFAPRIVATDPDDLRLLIQFAARLAAPLRYHPEVSNNLVDWFAASDDAVSLISQSNTGMGTFLFLDEEPGPRRFGRIGVEYLPRP